MKDLAVGEFLKGQLNFVRRRSKTKKETASLDWWLDEVRKLEARIRELERQLGRKTMEVEILKEALDRTQAKKLVLPWFSC